MTINAQGYYSQLRSHLNMGFYAIEPKNPGIIELKEKIDGQSKPQKVTLHFSGEAFAIKLDKGNNPLFHFLENNGKPWSKRCDFVVFHCHKSSLRIYCFEFKAASTFIPVDKIIWQLKASADWCRALNSTIKGYTKQNKKLLLTKYAVTNCANPAPDLETTGKYLRKEPTIRHYLFSELDGMNLKDLENKAVETIN
jgi:hypothetical protein